MLGMNPSKDEIGLLRKLGISITSSMLKNETVIQDKVNQVGCAATREALSYFDTDGSPIQIGDVKFTSKGRVPKKYQTPYGEVEISRHVYQSSSGGPTYCPLERDARIIQSATPKLAKMITYKYSMMSVDEVQRDLESNHGRKLSRDYIQRVADAVGAIALAKEEDWSYSSPDLNGSVKALSIGLDGTTMYLRNDGYRIAMVGTIALFDRNGERLHTIYIGASPEYGKETFFSRMTREIEHVRELYPKATCVGVADGAEDNWSFLRQHASILVTDFWHGVQYLSSVADVIFSSSQNTKRKEWMDQTCHNLKHKRGAASRILNEIKTYARQQKKRSRQDKEKLNKAITYFTNQQPRMKYSSILQDNLPIGSGVTEAACKTIVKQRLCRSGMKWSENGTAVVMSLRCLERSNRWEQFWQKINQYGGNYC